LAFQISYASAANSDLKSFRNFDRTLIRSAIEKHLVHAPTLTSKSRIKRMVEPFWSQYRLRVGEFRVYYDVDGENSVVTVIRILKKGSGTTPVEQP